ncbi:hypothetical protein [Halovenus sp. HT40]|uniref:hypothetical protein n=1 Tax=Halovenus sp. HT40 TaxID=3126691 RepID=UPI00300EFD86
MLLDTVDSESVVDEFDIGKHSKKHDYDNHLKVAVREEINLSDSLAELEEATDTEAEMEKMADSTFSRHTNDRAIVAVVRTMFELLCALIGCCLFSGLDNATRCGVACRRQSRKFGNTGTRRSGQLGNSSLSGWFAAAVSGCSG